MSNSKLIPFGNPGKGYTLAQTIYLGTRFTLPPISQLYRMYYDKKIATHARSNELFCLTPASTFRGANKGKLHAAMDNKTGEKYRIELPEKITKDGREISVLDKEDTSVSIKLEKMPGGKPAFEIQKDGKMSYFIQVNDSSKWLMHDYSSYRRDRTWGPLKHIKSNWVGLIATNEGGGEHYDTTFFNEPSDRLAVFRAMESQDTFLKALNANAVPALDFVDGVLEKNLVAPLKNMVDAAVRMETLAEKSRVSLHVFDWILNEPLSSPLSSFVDAADAMKLLAAKTEPVLGKVGAILDKEAVLAISQLIALEKQMKALAVKAETSLNTIYGTIDDRVVAPLWNLVNAVKEQ